MSDGQIDVSEVRPHQIFDHRTLDIPGEAKHLFQVAVEQSDESKKEKDIVIRFIKARCQGLPIMSTENSEVVLRVLAEKSLPLFFVSPHCRQRFTYDIRVPPKKQDFRPQMDVAEAS